MPVHDSSIGRSEALTFISARRRVEPEDRHGDEQCEPRWLEDLLSGTQVPRVRRVSDLLAWPREAEDGGRRETQGARQPARTRTRSA